MPIIAMAFADSATEEAAAQAYGFPDADSEESSAPMHWHACFRQSGRDAQGSRAAGKHRMLRRPADAAMACGIGSPP